MSNKGQLLFEFIAALCMVIQFTPQNSFKMCEIENVWKIMSHILAQNA